MAEEFGEATLQSTSSLSGAASGSSATLSSVSSFSGEAGDGSSSSLSSASSLSASASTITPQWWAVPSIIRMDPYNDYAFPAVYTTWLADKETSTPLTWAIVDGLNQETSYSSPVAISADGYFVVRMRAEMTLQGYLLHLVSGSAPSLEVTFDAYSDFSMLGGQWLLLEATAAVTSVSSYRTPHSLTQELSGVTAIRFKFTGTASVGAFHIYGYRSPQVAFYDAGGSRRLASTEVDFGMAGRRGSKDLVFRAFNSTSLAETPTLTFYASTDTSTGPQLLSELWLSKDGVSYSQASSLVLDEIPPGGLSAPIHVRRIAPDMHQSGTPWTVKAALFGSDDTAWMYFFLGDVDFMKGQPQIWNTSVSGAAPGDSVVIIAAGAGSSQSEFSTSAMIRQAPNDPIPMTVTSWTPVAATVPQTTIDASTGQYDADHSLITVTIPEGLEGPCTVALRCGYEVSNA